MTRISQRRFRILSPPCTEGGLFTTVAPIIRHVTSLHRPWAQLNAISLVPASAAVAGAIIVAPETASRAPGFPGRSTATRRLRRVTFGTIQRFRRRHALQLHRERRGRRAPSVTAIATFRIITCSLSTRNTRDTCAHCARNTCDLLPPCRPTMVNISYVALVSRSAVARGKQDLLLSCYRYRISWCFDS